MAGEVLNVRFGEVISIEDSTGCDEITVKIHPEDDAVKDSEIYKAFPLLPKMLRVKPKVGEAVLVVLSISTDPNSQRYYIGPVITQEKKMYKEGIISASAFLKGKVSELEVNDKIEGIYPNDEDIYIKGRKNSDIQITDDDIRIKAGVKLASGVNCENLKYNGTDPAYIKLKYHENGIVNDNNSTNGAEKQCKSTATIVANKINLISNFPERSGEWGTKTSNYTTNDTKDLITDDELKSVIDKAYKLPYGEKLADILTTLINAFINHTHPFPMLKPCDVSEIKELKEKKSKMLDDGELLSDTVRIN